MFGLGGRSKAGAVSPAPPPAKPARPIAAAAAAAEAAAAAGPQDGGDLSAVGALQTADGEGVVSAQKSRLGAFFSGAPRQQQQLGMNGLAGGGKATVLSRDPMSPAVLGSVESGLDQIRGPESAPGSPSGDAVVNTPVAAPLSGTPMFSSSRLFGGWRSASKTGPPLGPGATTDVEEAQGQAQFMAFSTPQPGGSTGLGVMDSGISKSALQAGKTPLPALAPPTSSASASASASAKSTAAAAAAAVGAAAAGKSAKSSKTSAVLFREAINLLCAVASIAAAINSYQTLSFAATDVRAVVATWQAAPISALALVSASAACPANYSEVLPFGWPGASSLGCGCPSGSALSSSSSACSSAQLAAGCSTSAPTGLPALPALASYRGSKLCYTRGLASYMDASDPDPTTGACGAGTHKCGASAAGTYTSERAQCVPDSLGPGCPVTWAGSEYMFGKTSAAAAAAAAAAASASSAQGSGSGSGSGTGTTAQQQAAAKAALKRQVFQPPPSGGAAPPLYVQSQTAASIPLQLPIIDLAFSLQQNADDRGPCYKGSSQSAYVFQSSGGLPQRPAPCSVADSRWVPVDLYSEQAWLGESLLGPGRPAGRCSGVPAGLLSAAAQTDYFTTARKCNDSSSAAAQARPDFLCEAGLPAAPAPAPSATVCAPADLQCQDTFYQSRCGHVARAALSAGDRKVGIYMRQQTYWKETCPHSPAQVRDSKDPFDSAITAQYALLVVNCCMNALQALVSVFIVLERLLRAKRQAQAEAEAGGVGADGKPRPKTEAEAAEEAKAKAKRTWISRAGKTAQLVKLPLIVASIVCVSAISSFYVALSQAKCSDALTNASFDTLGGSLPGVLWGNVATLVCDGTQVLVLPLLMLVLGRRRRGAGAGAGTGAVGGGGAATGAADSDTAVASASASASASAIASASKGSSSSSSGFGWGWAWGRGSAAAKAVPASPLSPGAKIKVPSSIEGVEMISF